MIVKIKKTKTEAFLPKKGSVEAAGYDLYTAEDTIINPGRNLVHTGISIQLPLGCHATVRPRSGFSLKGFQGVTDTRYDADVLLGTIDSDYRGEVGVIVKSHETRPFYVPAGTRIAQMVIQRHEAAVFEEVSELDDTDRGEGGFNSTGTR